MSIAKFKSILISEKITSEIAATDEDVSLFEKINDVVLPSDIKEYFILINGTNEEYDNQLFKFYSLSQFKSIDNELKLWDGIPDYSGIVDTLEDYKQYYIFADYSFHMFAYAIRLSRITCTENEIIVICGKEYKKVACSFSEFIDLYFCNPIILQL